MNIAKSIGEAFLNGTPGVSRSNELKLLGLTYATLVGIGVAAINHEHGLLLATKAGIVQAIYKGTSALFFLAI